MSLLLIDSILNQKWQDLFMFRLLVVQICFVNTHQLLYLIEKIFIAPAHLMPGYFKGGQSVSGDSVSGGPIRK